MAKLKEYRKKRTFISTPEPKSKNVTPSSKNLPRFCIQKHAASHLHYDFRLEYKGVMLSWAIPKGPSLNPSQKHLAIQVEDHPYEYRNFEGVIPEGNYGAGTVMIWDEGHYTISEASNRKDVEKRMEKSLENGKIEIELFGTKLKGKFDLIKLKNDDKGTSWLFFKKKDQYANAEEDVTQKDYSARSQRTLAEIAQGKKKEKFKKLKIKIQK